MGLPPRTDLDSDALTRDVHLLLGVPEPLEHRIDILLTGIPELLTGQTAKHRVPDPPVVVIGLIRTLETPLLDSRGDVVDLPAGRRSFLRSAVWFASGRHLRTELGIVS